MWLNMKIYLLFLCLFLVTHYAYTAMSVKQMNATKKIMRNTCQNKIKVSNELLEGMQQGEFTDDKTAQCYLHCILNTYKLLSKDVTFNWEEGIKTVQANAPQQIAEPAAISIRNCKDAIKTTSDKCVASQEIAICIYDDNPSNYFLP